MKILFTVFFDPQDLGCRYLAAYMKKQGHEVRIIALKSGLHGEMRTQPTQEEIEDRCRRVSGGKAGLSFWGQTQISDIELNLLTETVLKWQPDIMGFGTRSQNFIHLPRIIPALRAGAPQAFLAAGGFGPSLEPEIPLKLGVDAVLRGEGEYVLSDLVACLSTNTSWKNIPGIAYMEDGVLHSNPIRPAERNLDSFPFPLCDEKDVIIINDDKISQSVDIGKNNEKIWGQSSYFILSSRGCTAECSYCGARALRDLFKKEGVLIPRIRRRSLVNVLDELKIAKNTNINVIIFMDEFFIHPIDEMLSFFREYKEQINLPFWAHLSVDQLVKCPELIDAAIDAGWYNFVFGLQTGSEEFCKTMYNRKNNNDNIIKAVSLCYEKGMSGYLYMILGNPLESEEYFNYSLELIKNFPSFDESCKQRFFFETNKLRLPYGDVPLKTNHPEIIHLSYPNSQFYYNAMLLEFRLLFNDDEFSSLRNDKLYREYPHLLGELYQNTIYERHTSYFEKELKRIQGKNVFIYGGGEAYKQNRHLLKGINIRSILMDMPGPAEIDGIQVIHPEKAVINSENPIIIMARYQNMNTMYRKLRYRFPQLHDIIGCCLFNE